VEWSGVEWSGVEWRGGSGVVGMDVVGTDVVGMDVVGMDVVGGVWYDTVRSSTYLRQQTGVLNTVHMTLHYNIEYSIL
jgi:hypothetical protein